MKKIHRDTVMRLGVRVGTACSRILDKKMRNLPCEQIQVDEAWGFIGKKKKHLRPGDEERGLGDVWTFVALDPISKFPPTSLGSATATTQRFSWQSWPNASLIACKSVLTRWRPTWTQPERVFGADADYGQISKTYAVVNLNKDAASRYSPAEVISAEKLVISGEPDRAKICTSHVEKQNPTLRIHCRRLSRLTNAFSKARKL